MAARAVGGGFAAARHAGRAAQPVDMAVQPAHDMDDAGAERTVELLVDRADVAPLGRDARGAGAASGESRVRDSAVRGA